MRALLHKEIQHGGGPHRSVVGVCPLLSRSLRLRRRCIVFALGLCHATSNVHCTDRPTDRVRESVSESGAIKIALNATRERRASAAAASKRHSTRLGVRNRRPFPSDCDTLIRHNSQLGESQADSQSAVSLTHEVEHCSPSTLWEWFLEILYLRLVLGFDKTSYSNEERRRSL